MLRVAKLLLANVAVMLTLFLAIELTFRAARILVKGPEINWSEIIDHDRLGWVLNDRFQGLQRTNRCGEPVTRAPPKTQYLIRHDESDKDSFRLLFIGDSYTHAHEVSSGKAYYDLMLSALGPNFSASVLGVGGYGVSQEVRAFQEVYHEVKPNVVIWQFCNNDLSSSRYLLDNSSLYNVQRSRPYLNLDTSTYEIRNPGFFLFDMSLGLKWIFLKMLVIDSTYELGVIDSLNRLVSLDSDVMRAETRKGFRVLNREISVFRELFDGPVIAFNACRSPDRSAHLEFEEFLFRASQKHGLYYLKNFGVEIASDPSATCWPLDDHWNHRGNRTAAAKLLDEFRRYVRAP